MCFLCKTMADIDVNYTNGVHNHLMKYRQRRFNDHIALSISTMICIIYIDSESWAPAGIFVGGSEPQKGPPPKKKNCASTVLRGL